MFMFNFVVFSPQMVAIATKVLIISKDSMKPMINYIS